jgi:hypothetical protein
MVNVWGKQTEVNLGTWEEIRALGFNKNDCSFGSLNDGTPALYFYRYIPRVGYDWYLTVEKLENIHN